ncbi:MAG: FHA domain-containing serine/threonine-protein kinase [Planctomycetota bacterium]
MIPGLLVTASSKKLATEPSKKGIYIRFQEKEPFWLGRSIKADFMIDGDTTVSNRHCQFLLTGNKLCMKDESRNGTRLNSRNIHNTWTLLKLTDIIRVGSTHFQVVDVDSSSNTSEIEASACQEDINQQEKLSGDLHPILNLGPYQNIETIGSGSFGTVYKSFHKNWQMLLALKVFTRGQEPTHNFMGRFLREADLLKRLNNPFLIRLYDAGEIQQEGTTFNYMAMEYFPGVNLTDHLTTHLKISWQKVLKILIQTAEALEHMHSYEVIHRDIKPDNILYNDVKEVAKIIDLGLGKCITDEERTTFCITRTGSGLGTPNYMPIEQWKEAKNVNKTADIYSLGATAYYLLSGTPPYSKYNDYLELLQAINENKLIPLSEVCYPETPEELVRLITKMMSHHTKDRHSSAEELLSDLSKIAQKYQISIEEIRLKAKPFETLTSQPIPPS